jgi:rubredoxin
MFKVHVRPVVRRFACSSSTSTGWIFMKLHIWYFHEISYLGFSWNFIFGIFVKFHIWDFHEISYLGFSWNFVFGIFIEICGHILILLKLWKKIADTLREDLRTFVGFTFIREVDCVLCEWHFEAKEPVDLNIRPSTREIKSSLICRLLRDKHWKESWHARNAVEQKRPKK